MARKKHKTPEKLDYLFERDVISKKQYRDFWTGYWGESRQRDRDRFVDKFTEELFSGGTVQSGSITTSYEAAKRQAKEIGGYVVRRNKQGRFSKTGHRYQAIVQKKRKK